MNFDPITHARERYLASGGKIEAMKTALQTLLKEAHESGDQVSHPAIAHLAQLHLTGSSQDFNEHLSAISNANNLTPELSNELEYQAKKKAFDEGADATWNFQHPDLEQKPYSTLKAAIQDQHNFGDDIMHPAVEQLVDTTIHHPSMYPEHLKSVSQFHELSPDEEESLHQQVIKNKKGVEAAKFKDPLGEERDWSDVPIHLPDEDEETDLEHEYIPKNPGSAPISVDLNKLGVASASNLSRAKPSSLSDLEQFVAQARALPNPVSKSITQHFVRTYPEEMFGPHSAHSIISPRGNEFHTVLSGMYGTNSPEYTSLMARYGFNPMLGNPEYDILSRYARGQFSQLKPGDIDPDIHETLNYLIGKYGLDVPSSAPVYKGLYPSKNPKPEWHNLTSYSLNPATSKSFGSELLRVHNPGRMLPLPISGESEMIMPSGGAGRLQILDKHYEPALGSVVHEAERYPFSEYAEGGGVDSTKEYSGLNDPTGPQFLHRLGQLARLADTSIGAEQDPEDRARFVARMAENFYGLDSQGRVSLIRSHQPGIIDQFIAMPGGMAHLAGLVAQAGAASKFNLLHTMAPNLYDSAASWLSGPHPTSDAAAARLEEIHRQVGEAMGVPEAHGLKQHVLDAAGMLASPLPAAKLAGSSSKLQRMLEGLTNVRPPTMARYAGDTAMIGGISDIPDALESLHGASAPEVHPGIDYGMKFAQESSNAQQE